MVPFSHTYWQQTKLCTEAHVPTPRYGQYLTHAHNHITPAVVAMDSCFALFGAHQRGITVGSMSGEKTRVPKTLNCRGECKALLYAKGEAAVPGCHCRDDMVVRMRKVLAIPRSWYVCFSA